MSERVDIVVDRHDELYGATSLRGPRESMFDEWEAEPPVPMDAEPETELASEPAPVPPPKPEPEPDAVSVPPSHSALKEDWVAYAESLGHDVQGLTKEEIIQLVEGE